MSLRIGGASKNELLRGLAAHDVQLNDYARTLFADERFNTSAHARNVDVACMTLDALGLSEGGTFDTIVQAANAQGLDACPLELAPHLRLAYLDQPVGPYLTVASPKLGDEPEAPNGLYLRRLEDGLWLRGYRADDDYVYLPGFTAFVFLSESASG